jgi:hypothetical protein
MIGGEDYAELMSWKLRGSLRKKEKLLRKSLQGYFNRLTLKTHY